MKYCLFFLFFSSLYSGKPLEIVYHIGTLAHWEEIVYEQLQTLESSGLADACDRMTITVAGQDFQRVDQLLESYPLYAKTRLLHASDDVRVCEFPGIENG